MSKCLNLENNNKNFIFFIIKFIEYKEKFNSDIHKIEYLLIY